MPPRRPTEQETIDGVPSYSVAQFGSAMKSALGGLFPDGVWVEGEVEGLKPKPHPTGHYFSLVEGEGKNKATLDVKLFANSGSMQRVMKKMDDHGVPLANGMKVRFRCRVDFYVPRGQLSMIIDDVDTQFTLGELAAKREALIASLVAKGLHEKNKRRPVPLVPMRIGVVSSTQAAGFIDAVRHLEESGLGFQITVADVNVQGDQAPRQIAAAIRTLDARDDLDLIMVIRGGGSKGDLAAFDDELVAMAIVRCTHAVFTGIGHEIDTSVADIVAHTAFKTPTAVADELIRLVERFLSRLGTRARTLVDRTTSAVVRSRSRLVRAADRLRHRPEMVIASERHRIEMHSAALRLLDPATTMARGWSITRDEAGKVVRSTAQVAAGTQLVTSVADGTITSTVEGTN